MALILSGDTGPSIVSASAMPAGSVIQTVNATNATYTGTTGTTYIDTGLTASITPISASSKILVICSINGLSGSGTSACHKIQLLRNSTVISKIEGIAAYLGGGSTAERDVGSSFISYLDSPATTSATTYKAQFANAAGSGNVYINNYYTASGDSVSTITLMEIKQ